MMHYRCAVCGRTFPPEEVYTGFLPLNAKELIAGRFKICNRETLAEVFNAVLQHNMAQYAKRKRVGQR